MVKAANARLGPHQPRLTPDVAKRMLKGLVGSALARAQERAAEQGCDVQVFAFVCMSNHVHIVVRTSRKNLADFMGYFKARIAETLNYLTGRRGSFFARRYDAQPIRNLNAAAGRIAYTVNNPRNAKLVEHHSQWPGELLCYGFDLSDTLRFEYLRRMSWHEQKRPDDLHTCFDTATLTLSPLPHLTDIERSEYARMVESWIAEIEQDAHDNEHKGPKPKSTREVASLENIVDIALGHRPAHAARKRRPYGFGTAEEKRQYYEASSLKYAAYRDASDTFRTSNRNVAFPEGMYPPPLLTAA
jgi:REP element-mobilizing transposase RayT